MAIVRENKDVELYGELCCGVKRFAQLCGKWPSYISRLCTTNKLRFYSIDGVKFIPLTERETIIQRSLENLTAEQLEQEEEQTPAEQLEQEEEQTPAEQLEQEEEQNNFYSDSEF